jgi:hypothetical protein
MAKLKRNKLQRLEDLKYIKKLYLKGNISQNQITEKINERYAANGSDIQLSVQQIHYDIQSMIKELREDIPKDVSQIIAIQEQRILKVMQEAYLAWSRSIGKDIETIEQETTKPPKNEEEEEKQLYKTTTTKTKKLKGDPRYLIVIDNCIDKISKLHKLYDKEKDSDDNDKGLLPDLLEMLKPQRDK